MRAKRWGLSSLFLALSFDAALQIGAEQNAADASRRFEDASDTANDATYAAYGTPEYDILAAIEAAYTPAPAPLEWFTF